VELRERAQAGGLLDWSPTRLFDGGTLTGSHQRPSSPPGGSRSNAVAPGSTATGRLAQLPAERRAEMAASFALGRVEEPADTAGVVAFLVSEDAGFITSQVIYNTGGQHRPISRAG
jgi:hypothetical protein